MLEPENLAQLVLRLRIAKYGPNRRNADRESGIPYATWQNIEVRDTLPTLLTLTKLADKLDVPERTLRKAWDVSQAARDQKQLTPSEAAKQRALGGTRSTKRSPHQPEQ